MTTDSLSTETDQLSQKVSPFSTAVEPIIEALDSFDLAPVDPFEEPLADQLSDSAIQPFIDLSVEPLAELVDESTFVATPALPPPRNSAPTLSRPNNSRQSRSGITNYTINHGKLGSSLSYPCPACGTKFSSSLHDAGGTDHCPDCHMAFVVPGEQEYQAEMAKRSAEGAARKFVQDERMEASKKAVVNRVAEKDLKNQNVQLDHDPLREWLIYVGIMVVFLIFASGKYMVSAVMNDSSYLCIVIFVLFGIGLLINFRGIMRLRNEYVCAAVCMINLKKLNGLKTVARGPAAGILQQHVMDLSKIARYDESFTQDSLITLLYSRMMAKSKMVDILGGVLVTLGLVGTIVGLIAMTDGLSDTLSSLGDDGAAGDMLGGMRSTMSGLGTAFNTTLVGAILGSVVLRILNNVYTSNVDHLITYVASTAEISIVPQLKQQSRLKEAV